MPTTVPIALAISVADTAMSSERRPATARRANTSRKMRSAPSGNAALGPTGIMSGATPRAKSLSSGPCPATSGPTRENAISAATIAVPATADRFFRKRARARASSTD